MKRREADTAFNTAHGAVKRWIDRVDMQDDDTRRLLANIDTNALQEKTDGVVNKALAEVKDRRANATLPMMMRGYAVAAAQELAIGRDEAEVTRTFVEKLKGNLEEVPPPTPPRGNAR